MSVSTKEPKCHPRTGLYFQKNHEYSHISNITYHSKKTKLDIQINFADGTIEIYKNIQSIYCRKTQTTEELNIQKSVGYSIVISKSILQSVIVTTTLCFDHCRITKRPFDITDYFTGSVATTIAENDDFKSLCLNIDDGGDYPDLDDNVTIDDCGEIGEKWLIIHNIRKIFSQETDNHFSVSYIDYGSIDDGSTTKTVRINKSLCTEHGVLYTYKK